jgi:hypothetical protein
LVIEKPSPLAVFLDDLISTLSKQFLRRAKDIRQHPLTIVFNGQRKAIQLIVPKSQIPSETPNLNFAALNFN